MNSLYIQNILYKIMFIIVLFNSDMLK